MAMISYTAVTARTASWATMTKTISLAAMGGTIYPVTPMRIPSKLLTVRRIPFTAAAVKGTGPALIRKIPLTGAKRLMGNL
jgi:hypothetical protein